MQAVDIAIGGGPCQGGGVRSDVDGRQRCRYDVDTYAAFVGLAITVVVYVVANFGSGRVYGGVVVVAIVGKCTVLRRYLYVTALRQGYIRVAVVVVVKVLVVGDE